MLQHAAFSGKSADVVRRPTVTAAVSSKTWFTPYPCHGQGIFTFKILRKTPFEIVVRPSCTLSNSEWLSLVINHDRVQFFLGGESVKLLAEVCKEGIGYDPEKITSYWFSLNRDSLVLKYGKGYFMEETTLLCFSFLVGLTAEEQVKKRCEMKGLFGPQIPKVLELHDILVKDDLVKLYAMDAYRRNSLCKSIEEKPGATALAREIPSLKSTEGEECVALARDIVDIENRVDFYPQPLIVNWPFPVKDSSKASIFELDRNEYTFTANLPPECQELYVNISSSNMKLDWAPTDQKYKFSDAIRYSFETEGKILHSKLQHKKMKYIRVTVGPSRATSPGIPYVLELWPRNEGSPVHCHGDSYGVIKVLHGGLRVEIYNDDMKTMIKYFDVSEGDVTWMSPHWYQTHRLFNNTADFCATIQCYRYGLSDTRMWPYFDYVNENGSLGEFLPNSDFTFSELHQTLLEEYSRHMLSC